QPEQFVNEAALRGLSGNHGCENVRSADLARAPHCTFAHEAIDDGLDSRVRRPMLGGIGLEELTNRGGPFIPELIHDLELDFGQLCALHTPHSYLYRRSYLYSISYYYGV